MEQKRIINLGVLREALQTRTNMVWDMLAEGYPRLTRFDPPKVRLNNRLWRVAGYALCRDGSDNFVDVATKFFLFSEAYANEMENVVLPHEIIHVADYRLFGESEKNCGHGKKWAELMIYYGLPPNKYHSMEIPRSFHIKHIKTK